MKAALVLALAACGEPETITQRDATGEDCRIEAVAARLADPQALSCSPTAMDEAAQRIAHDCIVRANAEMTPFLALYELAGTDSRTARAYVGRVVAGTYTIDAVLYDGDPAGGGGEADPHATTLTCGALVDLGLCDAGELAVSLCLDCNPSTIIDNCPG